MLAKRVFDITFSFLGLLILWPLLVLIAIGILVSSPGPIFYRGLRTGKNGQMFKIWKFRTMVPDGEKLGGGTTALNDPRVFPFGRLLRHLKIDEIPQLLNVLYGEMSLVGPRPELARYTDQYSEEEKAILTVLPGITDFSSVKFSALDSIVGTSDADAAFEVNVLPEKNRLRLEYVRRRSFSIDLKIILRTFYCVLKKCFH